MAVVHSFPVAATLLKYFRQFRNDAHRLPRQQFCNRYFASVIKYRRDAGANKLCLWNTPITRLGDQVNLKDALEFITEEVKAHGQRPAGRKDIDEPTAHGELARILDGLSAYISSIGKPLGKFTRCATLPGARNPQEPWQECRIRHHLHERWKWCHQDAWHVSLNESPHHGQSLGK